MPIDAFSRRNFVKALAASDLGTAKLVAAAQTGSLPTQVPDEQPTESPQVVADRERRMRWWHQARFGMFIHWGLYSVIGQHEWAMENEGIPVPQYELLAQHFTPPPHAAREWARLARRAGQKYMVMTSKHHEGFCMWDTKLTDYCAAKQGPAKSTFSGTTFVGR